jgi:hypothetical protein
MTFQGAVIKEQGVSFAVVVVKKHVLDSSTEANSAIRSFYRVFGGIPVVLMAQDSRGVPSYFGRTDIVNFLANVPLSAIPWRQYSFN